MFRSNPGREEGRIGTIWAVDCADSSSRAKLSDSVCAIGWFAFPSAFDGLNHRASPVERSEFSILTLLLESLSFLAITGFDSTLPSRGGFGAIVVPGLTTAIRCQTFRE